MNSLFFEKLNNKLNMNELVSKPIIENDVAWQQHGTPDKVIDMMLEMYYENNEFKNNERILILFNVEFIKQIYFKYKDELIFGNLYFVADSKEKFEIIQKLYPNVHSVLCDEYNVEKLVEKIGEFNVKKFDVIFSNPPYTKNTDLTILKRIKDLSNIIIFIHPSSFLLSNKERKTDIYSSLIDSKNLKEIILLWGSRIFNIGLFLPLCISYWDNSYNSDIVLVKDKAISKGENYKINVHDISVYGKNVDAKYFIENFHKTHLDTFRNHYLNYGEVPGKFSVKFSIVRGHAGEFDKFQDDFFTFICQENKQIEKSNYCDESFVWQDLKKTHGMMNAIFSFNNKNERDNFIKYCKCKIPRFFLSYIKYNGNLFDSDRYVPWVDFTQEWNDAKLCKEFGISEELWKYIDNFIPNYYDDYKSGFEK